MDLKFESVFLLCALQCQSTHCNLPKVAAIYAIKHVFNIPEPRCVCVFLALSLTHSLSPTPTLLPASLALFLFVCVCVCLWSPQSSRLFPHRRRIVSRSETWPTGSGSLHWPTLARKKTPLSRSCRAPALSLLLSRLHCHCQPTIPSPPPTAVLPMAALSALFSGRSWVSRDCAAACGAAAAATVGSHGLGDRKELSVSHKQDPSWARYSQDLEKSLLGKSV